MVEKDKEKEKPAKKKSKKLLFILIGVLAGVGIIAGIVAIIVSASSAKIKSITINGVSKDIYLGSIDDSTATISYSFAPINAPASEISIYSENEDIAVVTDYDVKENYFVVKAVSAGETNIVVKSRKKQTTYDKCKINVIDQPVESFEFFNNKDHENKINSTLVKRDGSIYSVDFVCKPDRANYDNISIKYDTNVFESVAINKENKTIEIMAKRDTVADSSVITIGLLESTNEGAKKVKDIHFNVELESKSTEFVFEAMHDLSENYLVNDNRIYLGKESANNYVDISCKFSYILSNSNITIEDFDTDNYSVTYDASVLYIEPEEVQNINGETLYYFKISVLDSASINTITKVKFYNKTAKEYKNLEVVIVGTTMNPVENKNDSVVDDKKCSFNSNLNVSENNPIIRYITNIELTSGNGIEVKKVNDFDYKIGNYVYIKKVNNFYYLEKINDLDQNIELKISLMPTYFDSRVAGDKTSFTYTLTAE